MKIKKGQIVRVTANFNPRTQHLFVVLEDVEAKNDNHVLVKAFHFFRSDPLRRTPNFTYKINSHDWIYEVLT